MCAIVLTPVVVVFLVMMVYVFYWCAKMSSKAREKSKVKHPTDWEKLLEKERLNKKYREDGDIEDTEE